METTPPNAETSDQAPIPTSSSTPTKDPIPEEPKKHFFHWDYSNVAIGILVGWLIPMLLPSTVSPWTYTIESILLVWIIGCTGGAQGFGKDTFKKCIYTGLWLIVFCFVVVFTRNKQKDD